MIDGTNERQDSWEDYAFNEVNALIHSLNITQSNPLNVEAPKLRYLAALFAEMAYHLVPEWEVDKRKRAKIYRVPSEGYQLLVDQGLRGYANVVQSFIDADLPKPFTTSSAGIVAVGVVINGIMFVGFRGTALLFDWRVNVRAELVRVDSDHRITKHHWLDHCHIEDKKIISGGLHSGFAEEAVRITKRILDAIPEADRSSIKHVVFAGHSLGGAVAAISKLLITQWPITACIFGAPRYADAGFYLNGFDNYPIQIRRSGDLVPTVPPRSYGFCDHPNEFAINGEEYIDTSLNSWFTSDLCNWVRFLVTKRIAHNIEGYRKDIGKLAGAKFADKPLTKAVEITKKHI